MKSKLKQLLKVAGIYFVLSIPGCPVEEESDTQEIEGYGCVEFCEMHNDSLNVIRNNIENGDCSADIFEAECETFCTKYCNSNGIVEFEIGDSCLEETEQVDCESEFWENGLNFYGNDFPNCRQVFMDQLECEFD